MQWESAAGLSLKVGSFKEAHQNVFDLVVALKGTHNNGEMLEIVLTQCEGC